MESVYIETTVVSYLVSRPSRDILVAAHQQTTNEWWHSRRQEFECFISQIVIDEIEAGDLHSGRINGGIKLCMMIQLLMKLERQENVWQKSITLM